MNYYEFSSFYTYGKVIYYLCVLNIALKYNDYYSNEYLIKYPCFRHGFITAWHNYEQ